MWEVDEILSRFLVRSAPTLFGRTIEKLLMVTLTSILSLTQSV